MSHFDDYCTSFPNARLTRSKAGVLEVALHTDGNTLIFNGYIHEQLSTCSMRSGLTPITAWSS
jgi:hypothetical protein